MGRKPLGSTYFRDSPLNELCRSRPSDVISRYSTPGEDRMNPCCLWFADVFAELGLRADSSIELFSDWLESVRDHPVPTLPASTSYRTRESVIRNDAPP